MCWVHKHRWRKRKLFLNSWRSLLQVFMAFQHKIKSETLILLFLHLIPVYRKKAILDSHQSVLIVKKTAAVQYSSIAAMNQSHTLAEGVSGTHLSCCKWVINNTEYSRHDFIYLSLRSFQSSRSDSRCQMEALHYPQSWEKNSIKIWYFKTRYEPRYDQYLFNLKNKLLRHCFQLSFMSCY